MLDTSIQLTLFDQLVTRLGSLITSKDIKLIQAWNEQTENEPSETVRAYPYVCIDVSVEWMPEEAVSQVEQDQIWNNKQNGNAKITVRIVSDSLNRETKAFKDAEAIRQKVHRLLQGYEYTLTETTGTAPNTVTAPYAYFTRLNRTNSSMDTNHNRIMVLVNEYECTVCEMAYSKDTADATITTIDINKV